MASYRHINSNATTPVQAGTTTLNKIVVNNVGSAWTITVYNGPVANNDIVATLSGEINGGNYDYECTLPQGVYVVTSGTTPGDITIVFD